AAGFAAVAHPVAAAEAMRARRDAAILVPLAAARRAPPRARVQVRIAEHRADLLARLIRGADLVRHAEAVAVGLAGVAELAIPAGVHDQRRGAALVVLAVTDVARCDAAGALLPGEVADVVARRLVDAIGRAEEARRALVVGAAIALGAVGVGVAWAPAD